MEYCQLPIMLGSPMTHFCASVVSWQKGESGFSAKFAFQAHL